MKLGDMQGGYCIIWVKDHGGFSRMKRSVWIFIWLFDDRVNGDCYELNMRVKGKR